MKQVLNSEVLITNSNHEIEDYGGRVFDYALNHKKAKNKLLKGAKRTSSLEVERKPGCVTLRFCDGSYSEIIMPLIRAWQQKRGSTFKINEMELEIIEVVKGMENSEKHVDTKLILMANNDRIVIHAYNGTQNVMVQGQNYEKFALECLEPFFIQQIQVSKEEIFKFNNDVKNSLGPKRAIYKNPFDCPQCKVKATINWRLESPHEDMSF